MQRYRCPYCKQPIGSEPHGVCPNCGKGILIPSDVRPSKLQVKKRAKEQIRRAAEREKQSLSVPDIRAGRPVQLIVVMALLMIVGISLVMRARLAVPPAAQGHRVDRATKELRNLRIAVERFRRDTGRYPSTQEGLQALLVDPGATNWQGIYVTRLKPDPWQTPYQYAVQGTNLVLFSAGPDRQLRTADDLAPEPPTPEAVTPPERPRPPADARRPRMRFIPGG